jgi:pre-mRNA-splicing factor RBM22/SLT11
VATNVHTGASSSHSRPFLSLMLIVATRHEKPDENGLPQQNIKDRYYGNNDPVARKMLSSHAAEQGLKPPDDTTIVRPPSQILPKFVVLIGRMHQQASLFLTGLPATATQETLRTQVAQSIPSIPPAALKSIVHVEKTRCAFVNFKDRATAERAAEAWAMGLTVDGVKVNVRWGRGKATAAKASPAPTPTASSSTEVASS